MQVHSVWCDVWAVSVVPSCSASSRIEWVGSSKFTVRRNYKASFKFNSSTVICAHWAVRRWAQYRARCYSNSSLDERWGTRVVEHYLSHKQVELCTVNWYRADSSSAAKLSFWLFVEWRLIEYHSSKELGHSKQLCSNFWIFILSARRWSSVPRPETL